MTTEYDTDANRATLIAAEHAWQAEQIKVMQQLYAEHCQRHPTAVADLRRRAHSGYDVREAAEREMGAWQAKADALTARHAARERKGQPVLASEARRTRQVPPMRLRVLAPVT